MSVYSERGKRKLGAGVKSFSVNFVAASVVAERGNQFDIYPRISRSHNPPIQVIIGRCCLNKVYTHDERVTAAQQIVVFKRMTLAGLDPHFLCSTSINLVSNSLNYLLRE
jgi:hypothetical protein